MGDKLTHPSHPKLLSGQAMCEEWPDLSLPSDIANSPWFSFAFFAIQLLNRAFTLSRFHFGYSQLARKRASTKIAREGWRSQLFMWPTQHIERRIVATRTASEDQNLSDLCLWTTCFYVFVIFKELFLKMHKLEIFLRQLVTPLNIIKLCNYYRFNREIVAIIKKGGNYLSLGLFWLKKHSLLLYSTLITNLLYP